jgi:hypothetical protein
MGLLAQRVRKGVVSWGFAKLAATPSRRKAPSALPVDSPRRKTHSHTWPLVGTQRKTH